MFFFLLFICSLSLSCLQLVGSTKSSDTLSLGSLRAEPVSLENPDGRCIANALLQACAPMVVDIMNLHAQRTGNALTDEQLVRMATSNMCTRAELTAIGLMRTVVALNRMAPAVASKNNLFNSMLSVVNYGDSKAQNSIIAYDIATGMNRFTAARVAYCQLPADRDLQPSFVFGKHIEDQLRTSQRTSSPDYLIVDTSSNRTAAFDRHSNISETPLSLFLSAENQLPVAFTLNNQAGAEEQYELVSFCNFERPGMSSKSSYALRALAFVQWWAIRFIAPAHALPMRHATAVVRYGDTWFVADDRNIWEVAAQGYTALQVGQELLCHYPGTRVIVVYKKTNARPLVEKGDEAGVTLVLTKRPCLTPLPFGEKPVASLMAGTVSVLATIASLGVYGLAFKGAQDWTEMQKNILVQAMSFTSFMSILPVCGIAAYCFWQAGMIYKREATKLMLATDVEHKSSLHS